MSANSGETHLAERPRDGESWHEMIERQNRENTNRGGNVRELMRSLPDEQQQDKTPQGRGDILLPQDLRAEGERISYQDVLRDAARSAGREQDRGMER